MNRRLIVAALPHLAAEEALRREGLGGLAEPFALVQRTGSAERLVSTNAAGRAAGLAPGMGLADARALVPGLVTRPAAPERLARFWRALERWAERFSPLVGRDRGLDPLPRPATAAAPRGRGQGRQPGAREGRGTGGDGTGQAAARETAGTLSGAGALVIDATGAAALFGGEGAMVAAVVEGLAGLGLTAQAAMADTRGAAWAVAHFGEPSRHGEAHGARHGGGGRAGNRATAAGGPEDAAGAVAVVPAGATRQALEALPPAALRLERAAAEALAAVGLTRLGDLAGLPRGQLARRFGVAVVRRLDQALGLEPEPVAPARAAPHFAARLTLAEPIGLAADVTAGLDRLLERVTARLEAEARGARALRLTVRRVDGADRSVEIRLARPMRDPMRLRALFAPKIETLEAGFGIDALRLAATETEPMAPAQAGGLGDGGGGSAHRGGHAGAAAGPAAGGARAVAGAGAASAAHARAGEAARLADLMSRIGNRIGFENLQRLLPAESHIPERAFTIAAAGFSAPGDWGGGWSGDWGEGWGGGWDDSGPGVPGGDPWSGAAAGPPRPLVLFAPEPALPPDPAGRGDDPAAIPGWRPGDGAAQAPEARAATAAGTQVPPPARFRWRGRRLATAEAEGPERIAPEWWWDDPAWAGGPRDYWRVACREGPRLWLFHTPAAALPGWYVHGVFA